MQPGKLILLAILLITAIPVAVVFFVKSARRFSAVVTVVVAALCGLFSIASAWFGVRAILRGWVSLAKHGSPVTYTVSDEPVSYFAIVLFFIIFSSAMACAAFTLIKHRHHLNAW